MTAKRRATTDEPDLTAIPMTPIMEALGTVGIAAKDLRAATVILDELTLDGMEAGFAESQKISDMLTVQERPWSDRTRYGNHLKNKRGIDISSTGWRSHRAATPIVRQQVPAYLSDSELAEIQKAARAMLGTLQKIKAKRDRQYPALHESAMEAIESRKPLKSVNDEYLT
ncbi:hypothetical protein [Streptomyces sp. NPDC088752]|uniref:hypothetical protein n=1 Tax=Streptomyces sp. NPDC088752 TaxID=3154963 RepID=UPI00342670AD